MIKTTHKFHIRVALKKDIPVFRKIMNLSIQKLQKEFLSSQQIQASKEVMGLDTQLIVDGTYFTVSTPGAIVGCGGWSMRDTLYGGDHSKGRSSRLLDPKTESARIRAMYTHPDWVRHGIGKLILQKCENEAYKAGFSKAEMMATLAGVPLYEACGYNKIENVEDMTSTGIAVPLVRMGKPLT